MAAHASGAVQMHALALRAFPNRIRVKGKLQIQGVSLQNPTINWRSIYEPSDCLLQCRGGKIKNSGDFIAVSHNLAKPALGAK
jgi:hypothetical protein